MTDHEKILSEAELERLFSDARAVVTEPSDQLQARLVADAMSVHRARQESVAVSQYRSSKRWFEWLAWPTGLTAACAAGLWLGWTSGSELALTLDDVWISSVGEEIAYRLPGLAGTVAGY